MEPPVLIPLTPDPFSTVIYAGDTYINVFSQNHQRSTGNTHEATTVKWNTPTTTYYNVTTGAYSTVTNVYVNGLKYFENDAYSVAFAVNDNFSISYDKLVSTARISVQSETNVRTSRDRYLEVTTLQAAYNMGGAVLSVSQKDIENKDYAANVDLKEYMFGIKMAF